MKTLKILHLYYDLLNLYGENGNMRYLEKKLKDQNIPYEIEYKSLGDVIHFNDYDIVYVGTGSEGNIKMALDNMMKYRGEIYEAMKKSFYIITGDALALFGKEIHYLNGEVQKALYLLDYTSYEVEENIVGEQQYDCSLINKKVIGFQNRKFKLGEYKEHNPFTVRTGNSYDNEPDNDKEGIYRDGALGTFLIGPLLVRNPYLTDYLIKKICDMFTIEYRQVNTNESAYIAYSEYLKNFPS